VTNLATPQLSRAAAAEQGRDDAPDPSAASCDRASDAATSDRRRAAETGVACEPPPGSATDQ